MIETIYFIIIGIVPCIVWLLFYLSQDPHPEKVNKILEIYFLGGLTILPALLLELLLNPVCDLEGVFFALFLCSLGVGIIEEGVKFLPIKFRVLKSSHFDEPFDAIFYMVVSSLGFASIENLFAILKEEYIFPDAFLLTLIRFISAIFLHTLASALFGFFIALSIKEGKKIYLFEGFTLASLAHGIYNLLVGLGKWQREEVLIKSKVLSGILKIPSLPFWPFCFVLALGILTSFIILKVKKIPSVCKIKRNG
jgi:RsiW-degrading membrane proteinase PrsW (M82 family)